MRGGNKEAACFRAARMICVILLTGYLGPLALGEVVREGWQELLSAALQAYAEGDTRQAMVGMDRLYAHYAGEIESHPDLVGWVNPWYAELCYQEGRGEQAVRILEDFLRHFPQSPLRKRVCTSLVEIYLQEKQWDEAERLLESCLHLYQQDSDWEWFVLQQAQLSFSRGHWEVGYERSVPLIRDRSVSFAVRHAAWTLALQTGIRTGNLESAFSLLTDPELRMETFLEVFWLQEMNLRVANAFLERGQCHEAVALYRQIMPPAFLEEQQQANMAWLEQRLLPGGNDSWPLPVVERIPSRENLYFRQVLQRIQNKAGESADFRSPLYELHYAQALMLCERYREAWILLQELTHDQTLDEAIRREAHYRWLMVSIEMQRWDQALQLAMDYLSRYPASTEVPYICYMVVQAWEEKGDYLRSIDGLTDLLNRFEDHEHAGKWYYHRGYLKMVLEQYAAAREDYELCMLRFPGGDLYYDCLVWTGLAFMSDKHYLESVETWERGLTEVSEDHPMYPEFIYRLATAYYARQDWGKALYFVDRFLDHFPQHPRTDEGNILKGDIRMGTGELDEAIHSFLQVMVESPLYEYAVFQIGKIYRALEQHALMESHFLEYVNNTGLPVRSRVAEALYWIGWALEQQGKEEQSGVIYLEALSRLGDRLEEREVSMILQGWHALWKKYMRHLQEREPGLGNEEQLSVYPHDFNQWLSMQMTEALHERKLTWYSRLALMASELLEQRGERSEAEQILWQVGDRVPIARMDPQVVGKLGLLEMDSAENSQNDYFQYLIDHYADTVHRAVAWYGKARITHRRGDYAEAEAWLERFFRDFENHPLQIQAKLLQAENWVGLGELDRAISCFEELLKWRQARGRPHAQALLGMSRCWVMQGEVARAIAGLQRVYTLYRGFPDLVVEAYQTSAGLFEQIGDIQAAYHCWEALVENREYWSYLDMDRVAGEKKRLSLDL